MKKSDVVKTFIPITAVDQHNILVRSGIQFVNIRTGNRFHSTRNIRIFDRYKNKRDWETVMYAYNKVEDPRYFNEGRVLEQSEIYLNPKYKFLLDLNRSLKSVSKEEYLNFISKMNNIQPNKVNDTISWILAEFSIMNREILKFMPYSNMPILARKTLEQGEEKYYLIETYEDHLKEDYFNG